MVPDTLISFYQILNTKKAIFATEKTCAILSLYSTLKNAQFNSINV
jgi:hypothetical protein